MGLLRYIVDAVERVFSPGLLLDGALVERFREWSAARNTRKYCREQYKCLCWWVAELGGRDIRRLSLVRDVLPALDRAPSRAPRIAALKKLTSWLVYERHELDPRDNPCLALRCIQARPEQWRHSKVVPARVLARTRKLMPGRYRDGLDVLLGTGWHTTELERFAQAGELAPRPPQAEPDVAGVLVTRHKSGKTFRTAVSGRVLAAARRVRARGGICLSRLCKALRAAARAAGVEEWSPGRLRHTVATRAIEAGATPADVSAFLGHSDPRTLRRFYAVFCAAKKVPTLR